jgi:hypothetical protein
MRALRRDINRLAEDDRSALYAAIKEAGRAAAEPVASRIRGVLPRAGPNAGRLAADVRVSGNKTGATVRVGRKSIPYAGWVEFGGTRHAPHDSSREFIPTGRYIFPSAVGLGPMSADRYSVALARVFASSSSWTNTSNDPGAVHD